MKEYNIVDMTEIAEAIQSGEDVENDIGTVSDGFFWFPEEIQWAAQWQKDKEQDSDDEDEIMAGIEYWWHRSQIYSAAYLINNRPLVSTRYTEDVANSSLQELLRMQEEVKAGFAEQGLQIDKDAKPKDIWMVIRTTAQNIHNNVRGIH